MILIRFQLIRWATLSLLALQLLALAAGCHNEGRSAEPGIKVMTQNVYVGFDVGPLLAAQNPNQIPILAAQAFQQLLSTDFPERAEAIADKVALEQPHLIGFQEVALIRIQSPGDLVTGGTAPAEDVLFDYLEILLSALRARNIEYQIAGTVQNVDIEVPMLVSSNPVSFDDIRLTDFDVVLARSDVVVSNVMSANYAAKAFISNAGLEIPRGYVAVDATVKGNRSYRFVNTHLEDTPFQDVQLMQAQELAATLAAETKPVILLGDLNSSAPEGATYQFLESLGYVDCWLQNSRTDKGEGLTWGHEPDLRNETVQFTVRIDLVLVRPGKRPPAPQDLGTVFAEVWGDELDERTISGLWPSDHAGVIAEIRLPWPLLP
ncbi:MAG: endonuclease/exonuclease/phosphatase family protein [Planctomycetes bacterium]|nr:endonuclease/exonuclease/phosphatase family protein [Planctomycetota bacterium]